MVFGCHHFMRFVLGHDRMDSIPLTIDSALRGAFTRMWLGVPLERPRKYRPQPNE